MLAGHTHAPDPRSLEPWPQSSPSAQKEHGENESLEDSGHDGGHGDGGRLRRTRWRQTRHRRTRWRRQWREPRRRGQDLRNSACGVRQRAWVSYCLTRERQGRGRLTRQTSRRQAGAGANLPANSRRSVVMDILVARVELAALARAQLEEKVDGAMPVGGCIGGGMSLR